MRCEIWTGQPDPALPFLLFEEACSFTEALQMEDPERSVVVDLTWIRGDRLVRVLVDDMDWPATVQVVVAQ